MNNHMYIRFDDSGVSVSFSKHEFNKQPVTIIDGVEPVIGSQITINSFANLKVVALLMILAVSPLVIVINMTPSEVELSAERHAEARARCTEGVAAVEMSSIVGTKTINCKGE